LGKIEKHSEAGGFGKVEADFFKDPVGNFEVYFNIEYILNENMSLMLSYLMQSGRVSPSKLAMRQNISAQAT